MKPKHSERRSLPAWAAYALVAVAWPLWCEAGVFLGAFLGAAVANFGVLGAASTGVGPAVVMVAWGFASWALGRDLARRLPARIWVVTIVWLAIVTVVSLFALGVADVKEPLGVLGVVGPFLLGAIGFTVGVRQGA